MAELDYAFLADYATVAEGRLTAVGGSFTHLFSSNLPASITFSVAGRIRLLEDEPPPELEVSMHAPKSNANVNVSGILAPGRDAIAYDGKVGLLFALSAQLLIAYEELVEIKIRINGEEVRRLAFDVRLTAAPPSA